MNRPADEATNRCGSCGNDLRANARFCDGCGAAVSSPAITEYKQVTVLFVDVVGSMKLAAVLHPERLREIMNDLFNRAAAIVQRYQGTLDKFTGDGLMALFGAPIAMEDHALRACIAALEIQKATQKFAVEMFRRGDVRLQVRIGLKVMNNTMTAIGADLAIGAARRGRRDEAIDHLRNLSVLHRNGGFRVYVGCAGEALVRLLIERGSTGDLAEAHGIVDDSRARRPGSPATDLWWLKSRALSAKAEGDLDAYAELATQYLELCEKLDARGRLAEARQMARTGG